MEQRQTVNEKLTFVIKLGKEYKQDITFEDLCNMKGGGILPTDLVIDWSFRREENGFGAMSEDDISTYYVPILTVIRPRPENDDEFFNRKQYEHATIKQVDEKDKLEYLRLKAKFEPAQP